MKRSLAEELQQLHELRVSGALTEEEFATAKQKLLNEETSETFERSTFEGLGGRSHEEQSRRWAMLLHLSLLAGHVIPLAGFVAPVLIWQTKKEIYPDLEIHGRNAANWILSELIYLGIGILLTLFLIGFLILIPVGIAAVAFPILGALKASNGEAWKYPLTINFIK